MIFLALFFFSLNSFALQGLEEFLEDASSKGEVRFESRAFKDDHNVGTKDSGFGFFSRLESKLEKDIYEVKLRAMGRVDKNDASRSFFNLEEAYVKLMLDPVEILAGYKIFNWSTTEAFHPVDIINSRNFDSNFENLEKFGEPVLQVSYLLERGRFSIFTNPVYKDPKLPSSTNRLGTGNTFGDPIWLEKSAKESEDDFGFQGGAFFNYTIFDADIQLHALRQMDRHNPLITIDLASLTPRANYQMYNQYGLTYQHAIIEGYLAKIEAAYNDFANQQRTTIIDIDTLTFEQRDIEDHYVVALGLERQFAHKNGSETNLIFEAQSYFGVKKDIRARYNIFQRDILLGFRHALNDIDGKEINMIAIYDIERSNELFINMRYSQRLTDFWKVFWGIRFIDAPKKDTYARGLELLHNADQITLDISRYF